MACTNHPLVTTGIAPCASCAEPFCPDCLLDMDGRAVCASCKAREMADAAGGAPVAPPRRPHDPPTALPPWERREELGWWSALWQTAWQVIGDPVGFYRGMDTSVERWDALFLYPIFATVIAAIWLVLQLVGLGALLSYAQQAAGGGGQEIGSMLAGQGAMSCVGVVLAPVFAVIEVLIWAGAIHVALVVMKANTQSFPQTLRGCAYGYLPYGVIGLVPILGQLVGLVWMTVAQVIMAREVHGTTTARAVVAVLWVGVVCCCTTAAGVAAFAALVASSQ